MYHFETLSSDSRVGMRNGTGAGEKEGKECGAGTIQAQFVVPFFRSLSTGSFNYMIGCCVRQFSRGLRLGQPHGLVKHLE